MGKKILLVGTYILFILAGFSSFEVYSQCPDVSTTDPTASVSLQGSSNICSDDSISLTASINLNGATNPSYQWQVQVGSGSWTDISGATGTNLNSYTNVQNNSKFRIQIIFCKGDATNEKIFNSTTSGTVTVNQVTTATASITSNKTLVCPGENVSFNASLTNQGGSPAYSWRINGIERGTSSTFSWDQFNNGDSVQLWMTSSRPCATDGDTDANDIVESNTIAISLKPAVPDAPSSISGPQSLCPNTSGVTYSIAPVARATSYVWTLPSGWTGSSNSASIDITSGAIGNNQIIQVYAVNECGESTEASLSVNVGPGKPATPGAISDPGLICEAAALTFSVTNDLDVNSYTWAVPTGWNITGGQGTNQINVTAGNYSENGTVTVYSTNNCFDSDMQSINVSINEPIPSTPGTIGGDDIVCPNAEVTYFISAVTYADKYIWTLPDNSQVETSTPEITFNSGNTGDNKPISVVANNECGSSSPQSRTFNVYKDEPAAVSISGPNGETAFCENSTGVIFSVAADSNVDGYVWTLPTGWSITGGDNTNQITVSVGSFGEDGNITVEAVNNYCGSTSATLAVSVKDPAPDVSGLSITGETEICSNSTGITYEIPSVPYATEYNWTFPGNWSLISGQNTNKITVNAGTDDGQVMVEVSNECSASTEILTLDVITTDGPPAQPGAISSTQEFMENPLICPPLNGLTFSVPFVSSDITYDWILPVGWDIVDGENSNSITVNVTNSGNYNPTETIEVVAMNDCYSSAATTSFPMTIDDYIITDLGEDQTVCTTQTQINIPGEIRFGSAKKFNPKFSAVNGNGQNVSGNISGIPTNTNNYPNTFTFNYNATAADISSGSVKVSVQVPKPATSGNDPEACGTGYAEMTIFFRPAPTASIAATKEICDGQTGEVTFTATPNTTVTYKIGAGSNQTIQIGESGTATLTSATLNSDTTYSLVSIQYTQAPNCSKSITGNATIIVNPVPSADISYADQCTSESAAATVSYSNQVGAWDTGIFSATGDLGTNINADGSFTPANVAPGTYTVTYTITGSGGCADVPVTTEVTIYEEVIITTQPETTRVCEGSNAQFEVTATGEGLSYQWYKDSATSGNEVSNGTNAVLNLNGISAADAGDYIVVVSGSAPCSPVTSQAAILSIDEGISIDSQPVSNTICEGGTISLDVSASAGTFTGTDFSYQWYKGTPGSGAAISGANSSSFPLNTVSPDDSGDYYVEITGPADYTCTMATSSVANVEVRPTPTVQIGGDTSICDGESADIIFSGGTPNAIVQYIINNDSANPQNISLDANGEAILNSGNLYSTSNSDTDFIYELQSVAYANDPDCIASVNGTATVTVAPNPEVSISFADQTEFCTADNTAYTPTLEGTGTFSGGTFSANGLTIDPSTGEFTPGNEVAGNYTITYTIPAFSGCPEETVSLDISIYEEITITSQPSNLGICSTSDAEFSITATGDNLTYQWFKVVGDPDINPGVTETNDTSVSGGTSAILSLPVATSEDAGAYYVKVGGTNACTPTEDSQAVSDVVTLNIDEDIVILEPAEDIRVCDDTNASVEFKFVTHANGAPLTFEWIYADGTSVNPDGSRMVPNVIERTDYPGYENITVYEGTLTINNITSADQASYAVRIDGSVNNFTCPEAVSNSFNLDVDPLPDEPTVSTLVEYCIGDTPQALTATGATGATFTWYDSEGNELAGAPTPATDAAGDTSYFVSQKDSYCESPQAEIVVRVHNLPAPPPLTAEELNVEYCLGATASALSATASADHTIVWYDSETASTALESAPTPQTTSAGTIDFWVSQTDNITTCEGERVQIIVTINDLPDISIANSGNETICEGDEITLTASDANDTDSSTTYSWDWTGNTEAALTGPAQNFSPTETTTYTVTATSGSGCINTEEITIKVDPQPVGGTLDGPARVCVTDPNGELNLTDYSGTIARWEYKPESSSSWTAINEETPDSNYQFSGLTEATSYRVVVTNGVCNEVFSNDWNIGVDPEPVAGGVMFNGTDRVFMMCEFPTDDYLVPLQITGTYVGEIVAWQYRRNSATSWSVIINGDGSNFTGTNLTGQQVNSASNNESTLFRVEVQSGACAPNVYSDYATLSVIPSDIAPNPVTAQPGVICIGESISLSAGTGYGGYGTFEGGAFDNSSIANHGWRVMRYPGNTEYTFESAADNVRPDRWMRTNPHDFIMANPNGSGTINQRFDSSSGNEGNKGFAIVSGNNPSTLETPVFNTYTMDNPTLTFDQAYNLTPGDTIKVQISLDGGNTYVDEPLFVVGGPAVSGNYARFGDDGLGEPNNMEIDMSSYAGLGNLRIRWLYDGSTGGIYTIDDIGIPQDPQNVQLVWYYDDDLNDPDNPLEQIGEVNQGTVSYTPTKIGWNYFQVNTALVFDTNGDPCESAENQATIQVYVFDSYTTTATANVGSCGSSEVPLQGTLTGGTQGEITEFPIDDESTIAWTVVSGPDGYTFSESHFTTTGTIPAINDPNAIFNPPLEGNYTLGWTVTADERNTCPIVNGEITFNFVECTTLDFDGIDDYIDLGTNYTGNYFIEAWIRPEASVGTIISGPGFDIKMENLPASIVPNTRWYHIAVSNNGKLWVDGVDSGTTTITGNGANRTIIGARWNANDKTTENHFSGWIEEVRIWNNPPEQREIRFMMNQRLKLDGAGTVTSPLEGEVVPNRSVAGSYLTDGSGNNLHLEGDGTLKPFYDQVSADLAGYYRLISDNPDPAGLINFDPALQPSEGYTPDHAVNKVPGRLYNITTDQENTSPTPYLSGTDGAWTDVNTWARPAVWDYPNSSYNGTPLEWNIARINHNIESGSKAITMLGLLSETLDKRLNINPSQFIRISHYLLLDGNMDLQDESQLLQDHGSILANESQGWAEIDQQGRMSSFNYNYWTSPASNQGSDNNSGYMLNQVMMDGTNPNAPQAINFQNGYFVADKSKTSPITISNEWIWDFRGGTADIYGDWTHLGSDFTEIVGAGFSMKGTDGTVLPNTQTQNYAFRGKPNNGNIPTTELYLTNNKNYLVGNPYPSAIDAEKFLQDNLGVFNGAIYYWDHFSGSTHILEEYIGGYATFSLSGSAPAISNDWRINSEGGNGSKLPKRYIPVAQGFFLNSRSVSGQTFSGDINFNNTQRVFQPKSPDVSIFLQYEEELIKGKLQKDMSGSSDEDLRMKIRLKFESPKGYHRQILVTRDENTTNNFDIGYDAPLIENNLEDMYWWFDESAFVIQGVSSFEKEQILPLVIKTKEGGEFKIKIDKTENWPTAKELYLNDKLNDSIHDILKKDYIAETEAGEIKDRFELVFFKEMAQDPDPVISNPDELPNIDGLVGISYSTFSKQVKISNFDLLDVSKVMIFDMGGKLIQQYDEIPTEREILLGMRPVRSGVYIIKVFSENAISDKKVVIK